MSLRPCPSCGHRIAKSARTCPSCGKTFTSAATLFVAIIVGIAIFFLIAAAW